MCPITPVGRVLTCLCALSGPATMGMLVSVLVDRYQRVYNRKMYISEPEISSVDFDLTNDPDDDDMTSIFSLQKLSRRQKFSTTISPQLSSGHGKSKNDRKEAYKLQFVVSFNDKDRTVTDVVVATMKKKLTEVVSTSDIDVNLKLIDDECREVWAISSFDITTNSISNLTL
jgi:hypothetical protein